MFRWQGEDLILELKVIPKSTIDRLEFDADQLKLKIRAMPIDGKANQYLKKYLGNLFSVPQTRVMVEKGQNKTHKSVRIIQPGYLPPWVQQC